MVTQDEKNRSLRYQNKSSKCRHPCSLEPSLSLRELDETRIGARPIKEATLRAALRVAPIGSLGSLVRSCLGFALLSLLQGTNGTAPPAGLRAHSNGEVEVIHVVDRRIRESGSGIIDHSCSNEIRRIHRRSTIMHSCMSSRKIRRIGDARTCLLN